MALDLCTVKRQLQDHLQEGLLIVVGSGLSIAEGIPGMGLLAEHLKREVPPKLAAAPDPAWDSAASALDAGDNLEAAMGKVNLLSTTVETIVAETTRLILTAEHQVFERVLAGKRELPFTPFVKHLFKAGKKFHLITTNYDRLVEMAAEAAEIGVEFGGIDLSPAPHGSDSIVAAMEQAGHGPVGSPGTLSLAAALTEALRGTALPTCGYCGLMLPVMEDTLLARRWEEGWVGLDQLLAYSAVCGTGLDTVPLPGDSSVGELTRLICDMATLAVRLKKPLSARLLPVPGKGAGERTDFSSPYIVNTLIKPLAPGPFYPGPS